MSDSCAKCNKPVSKTSGIVTRHAQVICNRCGQVEFARLDDLARWRKWPEEKPVESGTYLVATEDAHCPVAYPLLTYYGASIGWPDYMSVTYWRPIGPLPGGE